MLPNKTEADWTGKDTAAEKGTLQHLLGLAYGQHRYKCLGCVAKERGLSLQQAERYVKQPRSATYVERYNRFKWTMALAQERFAFVEAEPTDDMTPQEVATLLKIKKNEKYRMVQEHVMCMKSCFAPMLNHIQHNLIDE